MLPLLMSPRQAPPTHVINGTVTSGEGLNVRPVRHALVQLQHDTDPAVQVTQTDGRGNYRFDHLAAAGQYRVMVQKTGFVKTEWHSLAADERQYGVTLVRGAAIEGRILTPAGDPLDNVVVKALRVSQDGRAPEAVKMARTDDLGGFRVHSLAAGEYVVSATFAYPSDTHAFYPSDRTDDPTKALSLAAGQEIHGIELVLVPPPKPQPRASSHDGNGGARIRGHVTAATTGKPIGDALVSLVWMRTDTAPEAEDRRTDSQGLFDFGGLSAGRYVLHVFANRYVPISLGQSRPGEPMRPIELRDGEVFQNADVSMPRIGAIEGTVLDESGDPAPDLTVNALTSVFAFGRRRLVPSAITRAVTDDRGHYRIADVPPGDYRVVAEADVFTDYKGPIGFSPTYFTGTADPRTAAIVHVPLGGEAPGASFSLLSARTVTVEGAVRGAEGAPAHALVALKTSESGGGSDFRTAHLTTAGDGRFRFANVPPGTYTMQAIELIDGRASADGLFGATQVTVADTDVTGADVQMTHGHSLTGQITVDDSSAPQPSASDVRVTLLPVETDFAPLERIDPPLPPVRGDLSFEMQNVTGLCRVVVSVGSAGLALHHIALNGRDVTDAVIDFRQNDIDGLQVVLTPRISHVTGTIVDDRGSPRTDYTVVVFSSDPSRWMERSRFVALARPNQQGVFTVKGLPADEYLAVALTGVDTMEAWDPEFLQTLRAIATPFSLNDGESKTLNLTLKRRLGSW
jgi:carboxypeptidase family protein